MTTVVPKSARQLRVALALRLGSAAVIIGAAAGGVAYTVATRRAEQAALARVVEAARHFEAPAMQIVNNDSVAGGHAELGRLLDRTRFVGIRVFTPGGTSIYETWAAIPPALLDAARGQRHAWPRAGERHENRVEVAGEQLLQIVLPLVGRDGAIAGYIEGVSRRDRAELQAQGREIRSGVLMAAAAVFATALLLYPLMLAMLQRSTALSHRLLDSHLSLMRSLGNAVAKRDSDTDAHNYRVTLYAVALAEAMDVPERERADLIIGAFLHDVGKIGIPDHILLKPGKLTSDEFELMKTHVLLGLDIIAGIPWLDNAARTILHHHERFDGTGYPDGLHGTAIPRPARLFAVADVFDALVSDRPYKQPIPPAEALSVIERESGHHFDPEVVPVFVRIAPALYARIAQATGAELRQGIRTTTSRYFPSTESDALLGG